MSLHLSRRRFLTLAASLPALAWVRESRGAVVERTLTAAPLSNGAWAFNGSLPGPTLEVFEGERLRVLFRNHLPQPSTIHWHGLAIPADQDGSPHDPVASGASRWYDFTLPAGSAGTYWYHPHVHGTTFEQVRRGLAGLLLVRAHDDALAASGIAETSLFVTEMRGALLVNGRLAPRIGIRQGETQRWRVVNATPGRYLRLALEGRTFTLAGTDGGLLEAPVEGMSEVLLAPAERVELLVTSHDVPGTIAWLDAIPYDAGGMMMGGMRGGGMRGGGMMGAQSTRRETLAALETVAGAAAPSTIPPRLRSIERLPVVPTRARLVLTGDGMMTPFAINGRTFDMDRIDLSSMRGEVQRWDIVNASMMDHPFHLHGSQFQVLARATRERFVEEGRSAWKDTVNVRPGETVSILFRHDHPGLWMYHCHILDHEDAGMMGTLRVA